MSKTTRVLFAVVACAFVVTHAVAQDDAAPSLKLGGGIRAGASWGDGDDNYGLNNVRLYLNGSVGPAAVEINTETSFGDENDLASGDELNVTILDAVAKLTVSGSANVWVGRFLAPSDRANLSGPYYLNTWNFPAGGTFGPHRYTSIHAGRDDGAAYRSAHAWPGRIGAAGRWLCRDDLVAGGSCRSRHHPLEAPMEREPRLHHRLALVPDAEPIRD